MAVARRSFLALTLAALAAPAVKRAARAEAPPLVLKLHHAFSAVSSVHAKFLAPWARKVEAESAGHLRIDLFPSMELGGAPAQLYDQARDGDADIVWTAPGLVPGRFPKIETFELPFLPSRRALVSSRALQDFAAIYLKEEFDDVHPICFSCADRGVIHAFAPVRSLADIKEMKLSVQTRLAGEAMRVLGAHAVPMPSEELPMAIAQHVVDGCVDPWHMVPPLRLNDLLKTHTEFSDWSLSSRTYVLAMNKSAYERLPRDLKSVFDNNSGELAAGLAGAMWDTQADAVAENVAQSGDIIITLLPEAVAHWRRATEPVVEAWLKETREHKIDGRRMIASAHALLAKYADLPAPQLPQAPPQPQASPQREGAGASQPHSAGVAAVPNANAPAAPQPAVKPVPPQPPHVATPAPPAPLAKPAPAAAHAPPAHIAKPAPAPAPPVLKPAPATASSPPVVKPVPPPPMPAPAPPSPKPLGIPL
jgi:TRAP-type C4-dicarboxylate transport system substrate-binding protein